MINRLTMPDGREITLRGIVAMDRDGVIGYKNDLIFHNKDDLQYFKSITMGHIILMGWNTFESMNRRILPGRQTIIMSRKENIQKRQKVLDALTPPEDTPNPIAISSMNEIATIIASRGNKIPRVFVVGGAQIYSLFYRYITSWIITIYRVSLEVDGVRLGLLPDRYYHKNIVKAECLKGIGTYYVGSIQSGFYDCPAGERIRYAIGIYRPFFQKTPLAEASVMSFDEEWDNYRYRNK